MQTYFTELPSPSLSHRAHKYTMKTYNNGKWQYFYDTITGRKQYRDAYYTAAKKRNEIVSTANANNASNSKKIGNAIQGKVKVLNNIIRTDLQNEARYQKQKAAGMNTDGIMRDRQYAKELGRRDYIRANKRLNDAVRIAAGQSRSAESMARAQDAKRAAAQRKYEMSVPERLSRSIKNKAKSAKKFVDTNITGKTYKDRAETFKSLKEKERKKTPLYPENNRDYARYDFAAQRAKSDYSRKSLFGKIESGAKKKTTAAKNSLADAFKKAKNLVRVENVRKTSSNLMPAGYQKVETVPKKKKKSK